MPDIELETKGLDDVDEDAPRFKRIVAVLVVSITLFGACVAYLQTVESNAEDIAARDAQRQAIAGLGEQVDASAGFAADLGISSGVDTQIELQALNAARVNALQGDPDVDVHLAESARYGASAGAIAGLTPVDPADPDTFSAAAASGNEATDAARLRQSVRADQANDRGSKADAYVAVLTVLAVSLFLLGLSLTVQGRSRRVLAAPGVVIALACVAWTGFIASRDVTRVSDTAVRLAAEGQALAGTQDFEAAIDAYDEAIDDSPEFGAAYARRGQAHFLQGATQLATAFISIADEDAVEAAIEDLDQALGLGMDSDVQTLSDAGFFNFLAEDFDRSAELNRQAIELNDQAAAVWFNLGVAELARDNGDSAEDAYLAGASVILDSPDAGTAQLILSGARTDLMVLRELLDDEEFDDIAGIVEDAESVLAETDLAIRPCLAEGGDCTGVDISGDAEVVSGTFSRSGGTVFADLETAGIDPGTPVAATWYIRTEPDQPLQQTALGLESVVVGDGGLVSTVTLPSDTGCPIGGEYFVRLVGGGRVIGESSGTIEPSPLADVFAPFSDRIEGIEVCVPDGFTSQRADVSALDAFTGFVSDTLGFGVNTTPGNEAVESGEDVARDIVASFVGGSPATVDVRTVVLNGTDVRGGFVALNGFAVSGLADGQPVAAAFAFGPAGTSHTILLTGSDDDALLDEVISLVTFTDLAATG